MQVTALAPTALEAEVLAKMALLRGSGAAHATLAHGGVVVHESSIVEVVSPPAFTQRDRHVPPRVRFELPETARWEAA